MEYDLKIWCGFILGTGLVFKLTKHNYVLEKRISLLENNLINLKERTSDLELFKLKCYSNEISVGRRAWDEENVFDDYDYEEEID